jgi:hypothetical protein
LGVIAEFFPQHLEDTHLTHLSKKHKIAAYFRYVDIFIIFYCHHTDINSIQYDLNRLHPNMKFTTEAESNNRIQVNYLDITIHRTPTNWVTSIHRKPTFTDTIIPHSSNHPAQHKYAAIRFLYNRLNTYHLNENERKEEENTIRNILSNDGFPVHTHIPPNHRKHTTTLIKDTNPTTRGAARWPTM